jgi:putative toxin-antitoxin system antitoxin component (TIGR02293 family)
VTSLHLQNLKTFQRQNPERQPERRTPMSYHALADALGITEPLDDPNLIEMTRRGLPAAAVDTLAGQLGISMTEMSRYLHVSHRTLLRNKGKTLDTHLSDHLVTVGKVFARCVEIFRSPDKASRWLKSPLPALGNAPPMDLQDTTTGATMVMNLLGRIEQGVYS